MHRGIWVNAASAAPPLRALRPARALPTDNRNEVTETSFPDESPDLRKPAARWDPLPASSFVKFTTRQDKVRDECSARSGDVEETWDGITFKFATIVAQPPL
jgi:hypothetical protein